MHEKLEQVRPADIEKRSFEIITEELRQKGKVLTPGTEPIVKRCIHTSADFDYATTWYFRREPWRRRWKRSGRAPR